MYKFNSIDHLSTEQIQEETNKLKVFLSTAPVDWSNENSKSHLLPNGQQITCVLWEGIFHISGTDIVRILLFRFQTINRLVTNFKKFEEGIFSDLRTLRPGIDSNLEESRSDFLVYLHQLHCIRTMKTQKVFYWFSVPYDRLFMDAMERELKRISFDVEPCTVAINNTPMEVSMELLRIQCQPLNGGFRTDTMSELPTHLNRIENWSKNYVDQSYVNDSYQYIQQQDQEPLGQSEENHNSNTNTSLPNIKTKFIDSTSSTYLSTPNLPFLTLQSPNYPFTPLSAIPQALSAIPFYSFIDSNKPSFKEENHFICTIPTCGRRFKRPDHLKRHQNSHHESFKPYSKSDLTKRGGLITPISDLQTSPISEMVSPMFSNFDSLFMGGMNMNMELSLDDTEESLFLASLFNPSAFIETT